MLKILLVDDDPDEFNLLEHAFAKVDESVKVIVAECCSNLLEEFDKHEPDIIFMDINLPRLTGIEWLKLIRSNEHYRSLRIIMYSTTRNEVSVSESYLNDANFYIVKPSTIQELEVVLQKVVAIDWSQGAKPTFDNFVIT